MTIDSSAIVAILLGEPEAGPFARAIERDPLRLLSAVSALEISLVVGNRKGPAASRDFDLIVQRAGIKIVPFDGEQFEVARAAWAKYGKGRHPASLNLGDCCSYALAWVSAEPLLAKGGDFVRTGLPLVELGAS